jgi:pimeloyl-ACP methyl ester carboxylesterase
MSFPGTQSVWRGFARWDFAFDSRPCIVCAPETAAPGRPWIWRARFFDAWPGTDTALLERGYHLAYMDVADMYGAPVAVSHWNRFHEFLVGTHGFAAKPALEGLSRGGLIIYNWAIANPDKVACLYADAPVCSILSWPGGKGVGPGSTNDWQKCLKAYGFTESEALSYGGGPLDNLGILAAASIPLLHVVGDADEVVPVAENTAILEQRYLDLGGSIEVIHKPACGHHPHSLEDVTPIVDFILRHTGAE